MICDICGNPILPYQEVYHGVEADAHVDCLDRLDLSDYELE